jgi:hypothetical protein
VGDVEAAFDVLSPTQRAFLHFLVREGAKFAVIGGFAVRTHGHMRFTDDLDIVVDRDATNLAVVAKALNSVGARGGLVDCENMGPRKKIVYDHFDGGIEIFTSVDGICDDEVFENRVAELDGQVPVPVISRDLLIRSKQVAVADEVRRDKCDVDESDLEALRACNVIS